MYIILLNVILGTYGIQLHLSINFAEQKKLKNLIRRSPRAMLMCLAKSENLSKHKVYEKLRQGLKYLVITLAHEFWHHGTPNGKRQMSMFVKRPPTATL